MKRLYLSMLLVTALMSCGMGYGVTTSVEYNLPTYVLDDALINDNFFIVAQNANQKEPTYNGRKSFQKWGDSKTSYYLFKGNAPTQLQ